MKAAEPESSARALLDHYRPASHAFDELLDAAGEVRPHWEPLVRAFSQLDREHLARKRESTRRILREHGATYNVYSDSQGLDRPWALDVFPFVIPADEWRELEAGLVQRARLLNRILKDIYGPQELLQEGLLPPALLHANPGYLHACRGIRPRDDCHLFLHAVDLARAPDGRWWVLADRTQAPSGAGYALENRLVLSRVFPDEFRESQVHRLAGFFQAARDKLIALAPTPRESPNVVLLTPGPFNETYFEQVFLARYLGLPLVEGGDLTVRDQRLFIKTLEGLQQVDVVLRRMDDTFCDPLELRADSALGVPGLVEAARAGNVTIANDLGSGVVEMPALMAFLPGLCRRLLHQELTLPSVATWWCGQPRELELVSERLEQLVIKRAFTPASTEPVFGAALDARAREALVTAMQAAPQEFVGQERVALSSAPVCDGGGLEARPCVLRAFVCADAMGYTVMPGALTRFSSSSDRLVVSMQSGGGSKDTWVLSEGPVNQLSLLKTSTLPVRLERAAAEVPSRVADNLFWLGRYTERLEDTVRILRCLLTRLSGEAGAEENPELGALIGLLVNLESLPARFRERYTLAGIERDIYAQVYEANRLGTVREVIGRLRHLAFNLRDRFSADTWTILNKLQVDARPRPGRPEATETLALLNAIVLDLAAFSGMEMENMTRGHGWRFLEVGRRLERSTNVLTLVQGAVGLGHQGTVVLEPILEIADSVMTYRRRYFSTPQWPGVLDLLLVDESNPRSLMFQLDSLENHAANLPRESAASPFQHPAAQVAALKRALTQANWMAAAQDPGVASSVLQQCVLDLRALSETITHLYFSHADTKVS